MAQPSLQSEERRALSDIVILVADESASQKIADRADELSRAFGLDTGSSADVDAILAKAAKIRSDQKLVEPNIEADGCDVVEHGSVSLATIPDARAFGMDLERTFVENARTGGIGVLLVGVLLITYFPPLTTWLPGWLGK